MTLLLFRCCPNVKDSWPLAEGRERVSWHGKLSFLCLKMDLTAFFSTLYTWATWVIYLELNCWISIKMCVGVCACACVCLYVYLGVCRARFGQGGNWVQRHWLIKFQGAKKVLSEHLFLSKSSSVRHSEFPDPLWLPGSCLDCSSGKARDVHNVLRISRGENCYLSAQHCYYAGLPPPATDFGFKC